MQASALDLGATGTGKTRRLQVLAEQRSAQGVPVFLADIKGDLSGVATPGAPSERTSTRATITSFGPTLLAKVRGLNEVQESSLGLVFHFADQQGLSLLDLADLRAVVQHLTSVEGSSTPPTCCAPRRTGAASSPASSCPTSSRSRRCS